MADEGDDVLTIAEIATKLRVSHMTIYRLVKLGELPAFRVGRSYRVTRREFDDFMKAAREGATHDSAEA